MPKATVVISADNQLKKGIDPAKKSMLELQSILSGIDKKISKGLNITSVVATAVAGFKLMSKAAKDYIDAYAEAEKVTMRLTAVWDNVGLATGKTAREIDNLAESLEKETYFSSEAIKESALLLAATESLTEDGFDRALTASLDLAAALGEDVTSAAQTLAKAIQEPEAALSRLKTIGVTFTDQEKKQIKTLADANKQYEAQTIILDKIEQKYADVAKAINDTPAGTLDNIRDVLGDIRENLGGALVNSLGPILEDIFGWLSRISEWVAQWSTSTNVISKLQTGSEDLTGFNIVDLELALKSVNEALKSNNSEVRAHSSSYEKYRKLLEDEIAYRKTLETVTAPTVSASTTGTIADFLKQYGSSSAAYLNAGYQQIIDNATSILDKITQTVPTSLAEMRQLLGLDENASGADINAAISSGKYEQILRQIIETYTEKLNPKEQIEPTEIEKILNDYGKESKTHNASILREQISRIEAVYEQASLEDQIVLGEILGSLNEQLDTLEGLEQKVTSGSFLDGLTNAIASVFEYHGLGNAEQSMSAAGTVVQTFVDNLGEAGTLIERLATNMTTMGPALGAIVTALQYVIEGFAEYIGPLLEDFVKDGIEPLREFGRAIGEILSPILEEVMPLVEESARILMGVFDALAIVLKPIVSLIATALTPIIQQLTMVLEIIEPILKVIGGVLITITTAFQWVADWIRYAFASVANWLADIEVFGYHPFGGMRTEANKPKSYGEMWQENWDKMNQGYEASTINSNAVDQAISSASYRGATNVTINIYAEGPIVGDGGMREFAQMIREEFDALNYYGVSA